MIPHAPELTIANDALNAPFGPHPDQVALAWLVAQQSGNANLRLIDVSAHSIGLQPGYLPSAIRLNWELAFAGSPTICPSPLVLASVMSQLGIGDEHTIVLYDEGHGRRALPIYRWLRRYGHQRVFTLAGGRAEWLRQKLELVREPKKYNSSSFTVRIGLGPRVQVS